MIDWGKVRELRDEVGAEDLQEVVDLFLEEVEGTIGELAHGPELEAQMHFIKGAALNLGFSDLADACYKGEKAAAEGDGDSVDLDEVKSTFSASKSLFLAELTTRLTA